MKEFELKYGCNPNQKPARIYMSNGSDLPIEILCGRPGYINFLMLLTLGSLLKSLRKLPDFPAPRPLSMFHRPLAAVGNKTPRKLKRPVLLMISRVLTTPLSHAHTQEQGVLTECLHSATDCFKRCLRRHYAKLIKREVSDGIDIRIV